MRPDDEDLDRVTVKMESLNRRLRQAERRFWLSVVGLVVACIGAAISIWRLLS